MRMWERSMKNCLEEKIRISWKEADIQKTVLRSKQAFYDSQAEQSLTKAEFLYQQGKYIKKRWWVLQGLLLLLLWMFLKYTESTYYIQRITGIVSPVFVLMIIPEIWKNKSVNAMEVECAAFYSIRQVYAARMVLFALADLILLSLFFLTVSCTVRIETEEFALQFFVPFNVACCICFRLLYSKRTDSEYLALLLCMVWIVVWGEVVLHETLYEALSGPVWAALLLLSGLYWGYSIRKGQKQCRENWESRSFMIRSL